MGVDDLDARLDARRFLPRSDARLSMFVAQQEEKEKDTTEADNLKILVLTPYGDGL